MGSFIAGLESSIPSRHLSNNILHQPFGLQLEKGVGHEEAIAPLENFDNLMMNNELSLYEKETNEQSWENEEASWEFEPIEKIEPEE